MKTKMHIFKYTFIVLSIMCCLLVGSTSIVEAISGTGTFSTINKQVNVSDSNVSPSGTTTTTTSTTATPNDTSVSPTQDSTSQATGPAITVDGLKPTQAISPASIVISAVGDLMAHQSNLNNAYSPDKGTYDFNGFLEYVKPILSKSDLTIGNFETVTGGPSSGYTSYPSFNTPDAMLSALSNAGFDVLSTANNHSLDRGINGLTRTIQKIEANKMINVGSSLNGKNKYITKEINGLKVSILSYSSFYNGNDARLTANQKQKYLSPINETQIKNDIQAVKAIGTDAIIVILHWGNEYQREPSSIQTSLSKKVLNWGADVILGSHPHVIQKSEITKVDGKNKFVIYSMGNFISGYRRTDLAKRPNKVYTEDGVIVQLNIEKDPNGGVIIKQADYIPTWVDKYYVKNRPVFKIIPIPSTNITGPYITNYNKAFIKQSYKNTMELMTKLK